MHVTNVIDYKPGTSAAMFDLQDNLTKISKNVNLKDVSLINLFDDVNSQKTLTGEL